MELEKFRNLFIEVLSNDKTFDLYNLKIENDSDLIELGLDSMNSLIFISALEEKINRKLDLDKLEKYNFQITINNLFQAFFSE